MVALIFSSFVAANRIGGGAQQLTLATLGVEAFLAPTVVLGRNPAKGAKGQAVEPKLFRGLLGDMEAEGLFGRARLVITGYFASAGQVRAAAEAIDAIRTASPGVRVVVDPILGDEPKGLYVKADAAQALAAELVPRADVLAPNAWELGYLTGEAIGGASDALRAARSLGRPVLATSIPAESGEIGMLAADGRARLFVHPRLPKAPNGTGDLVAGVLGAGLVQGLDFQAAAERAARAAAWAVAAAGEGDLPLAQLTAEPQAADFRVEIMDERDGR
jgi:pyridoxine kinase